MKTILITISLITACGTDPGKVSNPISTTVATTADPSSQVGPQGERGATGATGATGIGIDGATGAQGQAGQSIVGATGATGQSIVGPTGLQGIAGTNGTNGQSIVGPTGQQGIAGESIVGPTGAAGTNGTTGATGQAGSAGFFAAYSVENDYASPVGYMLDLNTIMLADGSFFYTSLGSGVYLGAPVYNNNNEQEYTGMCMFLSTNCSGTCWAGVNLNTTVTNIPVGAVFSNGTTLWKVMGNEAIMSNMPYHSYWSNNACTTYSGTSSSMVWEMNATVTLPAGITYPFGALEVKPM